MDFYLKLIVYALSAEVLRRFVLLLIGGFTGPLAKIPGPLVGKFTVIPWMIDAIQGEQMNKVPSLFETYGEIVRAGESLILTISAWKYTHSIQGPKLVVFADKLGIRKMLLEADLPKSPIYDAMRVHRDNATLFTETDKAAFKVSVLRDHFQSMIFANLFTVRGGCSQQDFRLLT